MDIFPEPAWHKILSNLDITSLMRMRNVSKYLKTLIDKLSVSRQHYKSLPSQGVNAIGMCGNTCIITCQSVAQVRIPIHDGDYMKVLRLCLCYQTQILTFIVFTGSFHAVTMLGSLHSTPWEPPSFILPLRPWPVF